MDLSVVLYNTQKKEMMGIFRTLAIASRYVFSELSTWNNSRIWNAYAYRTKLHIKTNFDFPIAVRMANEKQLEKLGKNDVVIFEGYPKMKNHRVKGVISCKTK